MVSLQMKGLIIMLPLSPSGSYGSPDEGLTVDVRMETLNNLDQFINYRGPTMDEAVHNHPYIRSEHQVKQNWSPTIQKHLQIIRFKIRNLIWDHNND